MSSPKQSSEPQDLIHRDSSSASSLHQISSQLLSGQTRKFSRLSAPKPRHEMPPAFLQVTLYSFLFWQEHLSSWSAKRQKYFCFLNQPTSQPTKQTSQKTASCPPMTAFKWLTWRTSSTKFQNLSDNATWPAPLVSLPPWKPEFLGGTLLVLQAPHATGQFQRSAHILQWIQWNDTSFPAFV